MKEGTNTRVLGLELSVLDFENRHCPLRVRSPLRPFIWHRDFPIVPEPRPVDASTRPLALNILISVSIPLS